jgi:hypothetical protein
MTMYDENRVVTLLREIDPPMPPPDRLLQVTRQARRHESRRASALAGVMALVLAAGVVSALRLDTRGGAEVLSVASAARATTAAGSARVSMAVDITKSANPALPAGPLMTMTGLLDFDHNRWAMTGTFGAGGSAFGGSRRFEMRAIGSDRWIKYAEPLPFGEAGKPWIHTVEKQQGTATFAADAQSADPDRLLEVLTSKGTTLSQVQAGDRTRTVLRVPADVLGTFDPAAQDAYADVTVESDSDGRIRLMTSEVTAKGLGTTRATFRYDDFGVEVDVQPPPGHQVQEAPTPASSGTSQEFSVGTGSSPADRERACEMFKRIRERQGEPQNEQDKAMRRQFDEVVARACN